MVSKAFQDQVIGILILTNLKKQKSLANYYIFFSLFSVEISKNVEEKHAANERRFQIRYLTHFGPISPFYVGPISPFDVGPMFPMFPFYSS